MITLGESFIRFMQVDRSPFTNSCYRNIVGRMIQSLGEDTLLIDVNYNRVATYFYDLLNNPPDGHALSSKTAGEYLRTIKRFFIFCVRCGDIARSPAEHISVRELKMEPERKDRAIPSDELAAMVATAKSHKRNYAIVLFLADTGCRVGGIASLTLDHLQLDKGTAWLLEKGSKWVKVHFGEQTADALRAWLEIRPNNCNHNYVFTSTATNGSRPLSRSTIGKIIEWLSAESGASKIWRPHAIRHAVAHALVKNGLPVSAVQRKLGHANPTVTIMMYYPQDDDYLHSISTQYSLAAVGNKADIVPEPEAHIETPAFEHLPFDE